jgi:hypothetical protein
MPALHRSPRHPAAGPGPSSRSPAALHQARIWLPGPETPQFSIRACPDILDAERRARRLLRQCTIEQLVYSTVQKPGEAGEQSWKRRAAALIESNPRSAAESSPQEMFLAAAYPDAIAAARARSKRFREQSSLTETAPANH